jgi:H/ACA ribonucleoprotein complex subunit 2
MAFFAASKARQVKRGVKEVAKAIRKGEKGCAKSFYFFSFLRNALLTEARNSLLVLAADITPIDIISHLPVLSEEAQIPYIFIASKEELGHASSTKRPTSCVMICPDSKRGGKSKAGDDDKEDYKELYDECYKEVSKLDQRVVF